MQSTEKSPQTTEGNISSTLDQLNNLITESLQVYELENQKTTIIDDLYASLKIITEFLSFSVQIHPDIFNISQDTTIMLLPNLDLIIKSPNGKTRIKKINEYSPELLTKILQYVIPQILQLITSEKSYLTEKITFLRSATKQLDQLNHLQEKTSNKTEVVDE